MKATCVPLLLLALLVSFPASMVAVPAWAYDVQRPHPRLVKLAEARTKTSTIRDLEKAAQVRLPSQEQEVVVKKQWEREHIRLFSVLYALTGKKEYLVKARKLATALAGLPDTPDDQQVRFRLQALAYYYDLCFPELREQEKKQIAGQIIRYINWLSPRYLKSTNYGGGHEMYANISALIGVLALYHEEPTAREMLPALVKNMKEGFMPFLGYLAAQDGGSAYGWEYGRYAFFDIIEFCAIWRNATGENLFPVNRWLDNSLLWMAYGTRDYQTNWGTGDNHCRYAAKDERIILRSLATEYHNGYARSLYSKLFTQKQGNEVEESFYDLLWGTDGPQPKPLDDLPLVKSFERVGCHVFRENWKGDGVCALFKCSPLYYTYHAHRDANSFEIWFKGDLAVDSGCYDTWGSSHYRNYYTRTIAHNTVLIDDPQEVFKMGGQALSNDGGQRFITRPAIQPRNVEELKSSLFKVAESSVRENTSDYALAVGDATQCYSAHKCRMCRRSFLFLKKVKNWGHPLVVVHDFVISTRPEYKKTWLLHTINRPEVKGSLITVDNGGGRLVVKVMEPRDVQIAMVGGPGKEFMVRGVNYPVSAVNEQEVRNWAGGWRIEETQQKPSADTTFLNILIPTEKGATRLPSISPLPRGVRIENWDITCDRDTLKATKRDR